MELFDQITQQMTQRLYEDERLRSHLTDDEAQIVLGWAEGWLETQIAAADNDTHAAQIAQNEFARLRQTVGAMNTLAAKEGALSLAEAVAVLEPQVKIQQAMSRQDVFKLLTQLIGTLWRMKESAS